MSKLIPLIREIRGGFFKVSVRLLIVFLMIAGAWVATRTLTSPEAIEINDKVIHAVVFISFAVLMDLATSRCPFWLWKGLPLLIYGAVIEVLQYFTPDRSFSLLDLLADLSGIVLYLILKSLLIWGALKYDMLMMSNRKY